MPATFASDDVSIRLKTSHLPESSQGVRFAASFGKGAFVKSEAIVHENKELEAFHSF